MTWRSLRLASLTAALAIVFDTAAAFAGTQVDGVLPSLPGPGILGLVAVGVVGAVAVARLRK